jgi:cysteine desulfurase/selenocysteine lyase
MAEAMAGPSRMTVSQPIDMATAAALDVEAIRAHFWFPERGRIVTNNAASTQPPRELVQLYRELAPEYENVHRGQSDASQAMTAQFEASFDTIAQFINAPGRESVAVYRNATEALNAVMYSLLTEFRDGDNVVTTMMEHNSNYVPWHALCREILPTFGVHVECRLVPFDHDTGELDLAQLAAQVDERTKLVCCTGVSNFLGTRPPLEAIRQIATRSGYRQPDGDRGSRLLIDGAQLVPSTLVDVQALDVDYLVFSFHKMLAPFGVGVLYAKPRLLRESRPFLYGGDMIAEGQVFPDHVVYNALPWKFAAGTPNILGTIASAQALRLLLDLALHPDGYEYFGSDREIAGPDVTVAMSSIAEHGRQLAKRALDNLGSLPGVTIYGPRTAECRASLVAFNVAGRNPFDIAHALNSAGVESRAGCHCATLAHHYLNIDPAASCRVSFYLYNTIDEVDLVSEALARIIAVGDG